MRAPILFATLAILAGCSPAPETAVKPPATREASTTYLASITVPLGPDERLEAFDFETWGVEVLAVCHIPPGWRIAAGGSAAPDGVIAGKGSHGVTWISDMTSLKNLVLVSLAGPVQQADRSNGSGVVPATFKGKASLETDDAPREVTLGHANVRLTPAEGCPRGTGAAG